MSQVRQWCHTCDMGHSIGLHAFLDSLGKQRMLWNPDLQCSSEITSSVARRNHTWFVMALVCLQTRSSLKLASLQMPSMVVWEIQEDQEESMKCHTDKNIDGQLDALCFGVALENGLRWTALPMKAMGMLLTVVRLVQRGWRSLFEVQQISPQW